MNGDKGSKERPPNEKSPTLQLDNTLPLLTHVSWEIWLAGMKGVEGVGSSPTPTVSTFVVHGPRPQLKPISLEGDNTPILI